MKTLLIMLLMSLCAIAWRSPDIMQAIGLAGNAQEMKDLAGTRQKEMSPKSLTVAAPPGRRPMSAEEFTQLSKKDPNAYQKYIGSYQVKEQERSEVDKLMNFLARGKYE